MIESTEPAAAKVIRGDIQGLRALAVLLVIAYHFVGRPSGGFLGVDVFFVISGFLIGGGLLNEAITRKGVSLVGFYRRRFWRLAPASVVVLAVTTALSHWILSVTEAKAVDGDAIWAFLMSANWRFAQQGVQYSNVGAADSPLLHFWSLAVEEQFYLVVPLLVLLITPALIKRSRPWRTAAVLVGALVFVLLAVSAWSTASQPAVAYFATYARAWELGVGVLLAALVRILPTAGRRPSLVAAYGGIAVILLAAVVVDKTSVFPFPWAVPAVLGTALVIWAGGAGTSAWVLRNRVARYVGDRSYSLYLWHFPAYVFVDRFHIGHKGIALAIALALTGGAAEFSFSLVERPLRAFGHHRATSRSGKRPSVWLVGAASLALIGGVGALAGWVVWRPVPSILGANVQEDWAQPLGTAEVDRQASVERALESRTWVSRESTVASTARVEEWDHCFMPWGTDSAQKFVDSAACAWGDPNASLSIYVLGDSISMSFVPAIREAYPNAYVRELTPGQCPLWDVGVRTWTDGQQSKQCDEAREVVLSTVEADHPDVVFVSSAVSTLRRLESQTKGDDAVKEWMDGMARTLPRLAAATDKVVILDEPPTSSRAVSECAWRFSRPSDCYYTFSDDDIAFASIQREALAASGVTNVDYPRTAQWFCDASGHCPAVVDGVALLADTGHLSQAGSMLLGPLLAERVPLSGGGVASSG